MDSKQVTRVPSFLDDMIKRDLKKRVLELNNTIGLAKSFEIKLELKIDQKGFVQLDNLQL